MKLQLKLIALLLFLLPTSLFADAFLMPGEVGKGELSKPFPQPYVVQKGDTMWDIAEEYFEDPYKWLKIWEQNLYVSNPDLIYPGNEIWLNMSPTVAIQTTVNLPKNIIRLEPKIIYKPAERIEKPVDTSTLQMALARQDFIDEKAIEGVGHIIDSEDDRLNYGSADKVYLTLDVKAKSGDIFDIFRTGDPIYDEIDGEKILAGYLVNHLGQVEVTSYVDGVYRGVILNSFEEIGRTDRLKRARSEDYKLKIEYPSAPLLGSVMYIRNDAAEAGQGQVIGINLGLADGLRAGYVLSVYRAGRKVLDQLYEEETYQNLPEEKVGEIVVLVPQEKASIALIIKSSIPINKKDLVRELSQ